MIARRFLAYFLLVAGFAVVTTIAFEVYALRRAADYAIEQHVLFSRSVARFVGGFVDYEGKLLDHLLADLPDRIDDPRAVAPRLRELRRLALDGGGVAVVDSARRIVAADLDRSDFPPPEALLPALRLAEGGGGRVVTDLFLGPDGKPRVAFVVGRERDGVWRAAVLPVRLDGEDFQRLFRYFMTDDRSRLQLLDSRGFALFSTREAERYGSVVHGTYLADQVRTGEPRAMRCHSCHENRRTEQVRRTEIIAVAPIEGTGWSVSVRQSQDDILAPTRAIALSSVALVSVILGTFIGFYVLLWRRVLRPIQKLVGAAASLAQEQNRESPPLDLDARDEIKTLATSLETMRRQEQQRDATGPVPAAPIPSPGSAREPEAIASQLSSDELRLGLERALDATLTTLASVKPICSAVLILGESPHFQSFYGARGVRLAGPEPLARALLEIGNERTHVSATELEERGVRVEEHTCTFQVERIDVNDSCRGQLWIGLGRDSDNLVPYVRPAIGLVASHIQHLVLRSALYDHLRREHDEKNRMLRHLFEAEDEERRRIASGIHDETAQTLDALLLHLETLPGPEDPKGQAKALERAKSLVERLIDETDRLVRKLRPAVLEDLGLVEAVRATGQNLLEGSGVAFQLDVEEGNGDDEDGNEEEGALDGDGDAVPREVEVAVYRVFQEAMTNVLRHAHAKAVRAYLRVRPGLLSASIEDDGCGMDLSWRNDPAARPRWGLLGMRERIVQLGGTIRFLAPAEGGTRIEIDVPLVRSGREGGEA